MYENILFHIQKKLIQLKGNNGFFYQFDFFKILYLDLTSSDIIRKRIFEYGSVFFDNLITLVLPVRSPKTKL